MDVGWMKTITNDENIYFEERTGKEMDSNIILRLLQLHTNENNEGNWQITNKSMKLNKGENKPTGNETMLTY